MDLTYQYAPDPEAANDWTSRVFGDTDGVTSGYLVVYDDSCIDGDIVRPYVCQPMTVAVTTDEDGLHHIETL